MTAGGTRQALEGFFFQDFYHVTILPLLAATIGLAWFARPSAKEKFPSGFRSFQASYLLVWALCAAADWLQGPYTYVLYAAYGFSNNEIAQLFVVGYVSSLVFGCFVGSLTDKFGRKKCCLLYCVLYFLSCVTKHFRHYRLLMLGRITGGIATSILNSCFECWMVSEHIQRRGFPDSLLAFMFSMMYTVMYCVAIFSGLAGQAAVDAFAFVPVGGSDSLLYVGGYCGPFDLSIVCTTLGGVLIAAVWEENYGSPEASGAKGPILGLVQNLKAACGVILSDSRVLALGVVVSFFEGSMFAWVFNWTPALESARIPPPHGVIFALFMMSCMCGASTSILMGNMARPRISLFVACSVSLIAFLISAHTAAVGGQSETNLQITLTAFMVYEFCVGIYFPSVGTLKSEIVPEELRGTVYNLYRMPLNAIVVGLLLGNISAVTCFRLNAVLLLGALWSLLAVRPGLQRKKFSDIELASIRYEKVAQVEPTDDGVEVSVIGKRAGVASPTGNVDAALGWKSSP
mmetsp:Transcript_68578/g.200648  ORF Transcript_68578/g.200648 Transcript_68578/m.200648 type:complete len:516 (-) Transcript_68578:394-1941(-)